jgi:hypothetical protein
MMTQDEFLERLWLEVVRGASDGKWIDSTIKAAKKTKFPAERRHGELLAAMLARGVTKEQIAELLEHDRREMVFEVIHMVEVDGVEPEAWEGIHEAYDGADPGDFDKPGASAAAANGPVLSLKQTHHVAFSPDAKRVVAATGGRVWDLASGKEVARCELPPHTSFVAWSPAGKVIAMQSTTGAIRLCDAKTGKQLVQVKMACEGTSMAFSPDGKVLFAGDWDGNLFAWSVPTGKLLHKRETGGMIHDVRATPDQVGITCGDDAIGFDATLKTERWRASNKDLDSACLHLSGKERVLVGWDRKRLVKLALGTGKELASAKPKVEKHAKSTAVSPDGKYVCAVHGDEFILLDASLRERGRQRIEYANTATFSPDSRLLALSSWGKGEVWPVEAFPKSPV